MSDNQAGAVDYERAKDYFWAKLADDRHGKGRMESAFYHTAQWIFMQGCGERDKMLARIAELEKEVDNLPCDAHCAALSERTYMQMEFDEKYGGLLAAAKNLRDVKGRYHSELAFNALVEAIAKVESIHA